jgi:multisubunit Na+/H+ antiporter MnhF subunit
MAAARHPVAIEHVPGFITAPGETDVLMWVMAIVLLAAVLGFGILFLRLHSLPERIAHKSHKLQFEIVAVLCLIALFTHIHIFWVIGLVLAMIDFPDIGGWLGRIAGSVEKIAENKSGDAGSHTSGDAPNVLHDGVTTIRRGDSPTVVPARPGLEPAGRRG